ncbi:MAG: 50S ribosomal protein L29 [archaeon]
MKKKDLWKLTPSEIEKKLKESRAQLSREMSKRATGGAPTKVSAIRNLRRTIAQFLTVSAAISAGKNKTNEDVKKQ